MATKKSIRESTAHTGAFNSKHHVAHQKAYLSRRKAGMVAALLPWRWLTLLDVQRLAVEAYRSASYDLSRDLPDPNCSPENFAFLLQQAFEVLVADAALAAGVPAAPAGAPHFARCMREAVPADWKSQYPVFVSAPGNDGQEDKLHPPVEASALPLDGAEFEAFCAEREAVIADTRKVLDVAYAAHLVLAPAGGSHDL